MNKTCLLTHPHVLAHLSSQVWEVIRNLQRKTMRIWTLKLPTCPPSIPQPQIIALNPKLIFLWKVSALFIQGVRRDSGFGSVLITESVSLNLQHCHYSVKIVQYLKSGCTDHDRENICMVGDWTIFGPFWHSLCKRNVHFIKLSNKVILAW